jgi:hypothetical protein
MHWTFIHENLSRGKTAEFCGVRVKRQKLRENCVQPEKFAHFLRSARGSASGLTRQPGTGCGKR